MKMYGHPKNSKSERPMQLEEVAIAASIADLAIIRDFITHVMARIQNKEGFDHVHLQDFARGSYAKCDIIVLWPEEV